MKSKAFITNLLFLLFSILAGIVMSEIICRLVVTNNIIFETSLDHDLLTYDRNLGWINKPNTETYYRNDFIGFNSRVTFDKYGIRNNDNPDMKNIEKKILVLGDSTTAALEVDNNKTYVALLEKFFQNDSYNFKFYNAGVRGYGTVQSFLNLKRLYNIIQPDYIIYMFCGNDFEENRTIKKGERLYGKPVYIMSNEGLTLVNSPSKKYQRSYFAHIEYSDNNYYIHEGYVISRGKYIQKIKDFLDRRMVLYNLVRYVYYKHTHMRQREMNKITIEKDLDLFFLLLKEMSEIDRDLILTSFISSIAREDVNAKEFELIAEKLHINYLNLSPYFNSKEKYDYRFDAHWNEKGHLQAAKALYKLLKPTLTAN